MVDSILTPNESIYDTSESNPEEIYFIVDNYLSELNTEAKQSIVRENLGVYGKQDLYTQVEVDNNIDKKVNDSIKNHLTSYDPHQILPKVNNLLKTVIKSDGTTPFTSPQSGVTPFKEEHLTTKGYVENLLNTHLKKTDPHNVLKLVDEVLKQYALKSDVPYRNEIYTRAQIDKANKNFIKTDGTVSFTAPQKGVTPTLDQHLTTKKYVDNAIFKHSVEVDPHGLLTILNQRFGDYYKMSETYSKAETYSRTQLDKVINTLVIDAVKQAIREHVNTFDPHNILGEVFKEHYIKRDGSIPFTSIQKGVAGEEFNDLATVGQIKEIEQQLNTKVESYQPIWVTSGPIQTTVGFMEDESDVPNAMTFQEAMDAIFYGKIVEIITPKVAAAGMQVPVTMNIRGNSFFEKAELYQNGILIGTYTLDDFAEWSYTVESNPVISNTTFDFKVYFTNGAETSASSITNISFGIFVGAVPRICQPGDITRNVMLKMIEDDPVNHAMYYEEPIKHKFNFVCKNEPYKLVIAIPEEEKQLDYMITSSQHFNLDAFTVTKVPIIIPGNNKAVMYNFYVYRENLIALNSEVTFKLI